MVNRGTEFIVTEEGREFLTPIYFIEYTAKDVSLLATIFSTAVVSIVSTLLLTGD